MFFQYAIQVNSVKNDRRSQANRTEQRAEVFIEGPALDTQVMQGLLAVEATLIHRFLSGTPWLERPLPEPFVSPPVRGH